MLRGYHKNTHAVTDSLHNRYPHMFLFVSNKPIIADELLSNQYQQVLPYCYSNIKAFCVVVMFNLIILFLTSRTFQPRAFIVARSLVLQLNLSVRGQHACILSKVLWNFNRSGRLLTAEAAIFFGV